jgi:hypothetical protein
VNRALDRVFDPPEGPLLGPPRYRCAPDHGRRRRVRMSDAENAYSDAIDPDATPTWAWPTPIRDPLSSAAILTSP